MAFPPFSTSSPKPSTVLQPYINKVAVMIKIFIKLLVLIFMMFSFFAINYLIKCMINESIETTKNRENNIFAILVACEATPPKPKIPATIAIIKNISVQWSINLFSLN